MSDASNTWEQSENGKVLEGQDVNPAPPDSKNC